MHDAVTGMMIHYRFTLACFSRHPDWSVRAGGIARLVEVLGHGSTEAQDQAAGALAALALENTKNELSIADLIVSLTLTLTRTLTLGS